MRSYAHDPWTQVNGEVVAWKPNLRSGWRTVPLASKLIGTLLAQRFGRADERAE